MLVAEEKGITQANVDEVKGSSQDPEIQRLLGIKDKMGEGMGLSNDWPITSLKPWAIMANPLSVISVNPLPLSWSVV